MNTIRRGIMPHSAAGAWAALLTLCACAPHATFTPRGGSCPKRAAGCDFELISSRPARDYAVIGVLDLEAFHVRTLPNDDASFRKVIAKEVCSAGGDAVLPGINGNGRYVLATIVKWVEPGATGDACPKATDAGADTGSAADAGAPTAALPTQPAGARW